MSGLNGKENSKIYIRNLRSVLSQHYFKTGRVEIVWSSCYNSQICREEVMEELEDKISACFIDHKWAVNQTFNKSCLEAVKYLGEFDGFLYMASDTFFAKEDLGSLERLVLRLNEPKNGIIYPEVDNDSGLYWHLNFPEEKQLWEVYDRNKGDLILPLGATGNLHLAIFSSQLLQQFGQILPDVFVSYCTETIFSYLAASIGQRMIITNDVIVHHRDKKDVRGESVQSVDGQTKAFGAGWDRLFSDKCRSIAEIIKDPKAYEVGLGYEVWVKNFRDRMDIPKDKPWLEHNPSCFDENGLAKTQELRNFIKENFYLSPVLLDYETVKVEFRKKGE